MFIANNLDVLLIEISKIIGEKAKNKDELMFLNRIILFEYLEQVNNNKDLDKFDMRKKCEKIISYAQLLKEKIISRRVKNQVFKMLFDPVNLDKLGMDIVKEFNFFIINDEEIICNSIKKLFDENPDAIKDYKTKEKKRSKVFDFFVGRVHKDLNDKAEPDLVDKLVMNNLKKLI